MALNKLFPEPEARRIVLDGVSPVGTEKLLLRKAAGYVLADDLASLRTQPPFDASAMDGYAVRQADLAALPVTLSVIGEARAGKPFDMALKAGDAVRIFTGAAMPEGADSIVIQENTESGNNEVRVLQGVTPGKFIRKAGLDFKIGDILLNRGEKLTPNRLALAASMNHAELPVYRKPRMALLATGDELVLPGHAIGRGQIIASNTFGLVAAAENVGAEVLDLGIVKDTSEALAHALNGALGQLVDLIVTTGGASVGDHDLVLPSAQEAGFEFEVAKIAMRPGKPFLFGKRKIQGHMVRLVGLAGNPVSSLVAFSVFVRPLIQLLGGTSASELAMQSGILGRDLPKNDERAEYLRASLQSTKNRLPVATPFDAQDSSMLARLVQAECLVYREAHAAKAKAGDPCKFISIAE